MNRKVNVPVKQSVYPMAKHTLTKGYALMEMLICLFIVSAIAMSFSINKYSYNDEYDTFMARYLYHQSVAIYNNEKTVLEGYDNITFKENGNVNKAQTIYFDKGKVVIELGGGRLVFK